MRGYELLEKMELVELRYVEEAEKPPKALKKRWIQWCAAAACICLICGAASLLQRQAAEDPMDGVDLIDTEGPYTPWTAVFNEVTTILDAARQYVPGYFTEELSQQEIAALEPGMRIEYMEYFGYAGFDGEGKLVDVILSVTTSIPETAVTVAISENGTGRCYTLSGEPVVSVCNKTEYTVYQYAVNDSIYLEAQASINGYAFCFSMEATQKQKEQAKEDFQRILECFAYYEEGKPDLSAVTPKEIPEFLDTELTYTNAVNDPDFGAYLLKNVPEGFGAESIRRYKDQNDDYLSGLWTRGYDELRWKVSCYEEADGERITGITETENYDLSLYPIPRAESVPDALRTIVDDPIFLAQELTLEAVWARAYQTGEAGDSEGWRMSFSVKYDDVIVHISAKGLDPQWLYERLKELTK